MADLFDGYQSDKTGLLTRAFDEVVDEVVDDAVEPRDQYAEVLSAISQLDP